MKNIVFLLFCAACLFLAIYTYRLYVTSQNQVALANQRLLDRDTLIYKLQKQLPGTDTTATQAKIIPRPSTLGKLSASEIEQLKAKGLNNPEADLKADLTSNQQDVLPSKGTLGGTPAIRDIQILTGRYALAYFEDGHNGGYLLLRYSLNQVNSISWVVIDSYFI